jgi:hypothetical protein
MAYCGRDFSPSEQAESQMYGFDFVNDLAENEALASVVWELLVRKGVDPNPSAHLVGAPFLVVPDGTSVQTATTQRIAGLLPNVVYTVRAVATTNTGNIKTLWSHARGDPVE